MVPGLPVRSAGFSPISGLLLKPPLSARGRLINRLTRGRETREF
jgi:hypothetical protein